MVGPFITGTPAEIEPTSHTWEAVQPRAAPGRSEEDGPRRDQLLLRIGAARKEAGSTFRAAADQKLTCLSFRQKFSASSADLFDRLVENR